MLSKNVPRTFQERFAQRLSTTNTSIGDGTTLTGVGVWAFTVGLPIQTNIRPGGAFY